MKNVGGANTTNVVDGHWDAPIYVNPSWPTGTYRVSAICYSQENNYAFTYKDQTLTVTE